MNLGFVGIGKMGKPMATNLLKAGYSVSAYDVDNSRLELVSKEGASIGSSPKEVSKAAELILLSLPYPETVIEVIAGENGILEGIKKNSIIADLSTVLPETIIDLVPLVERKECKILDAPVSGGVLGAEGGTLTIMVGGDIEAFQVCKPIFEVIGKEIYHLGQVGSGLLVKLVNQLLFALNLASMAEALSLVSETGTDPEKLVEVILSCSGSSYALKTRFQTHILRKYFEPGFEVDLMLKDLSLVSRMAENRDFPLVLGETVLQLFRLAKRRGYGKKDVCGLVCVMEELVNKQMVKGF